MSLKKQILMDYGYLFFPLYFFCYIKFTLFFSKYTVSFWKNIFSEKKHIKHKNNNKQTKSSFNKKHNLVFFEMKCNKFWKFSKFCFLVLFFILRKNFFIFIYLIFQNLILKNKINNVKITSEKIITNNKNMFFEKQSNDGKHENCKNELFL